MYRFEHADYIPFLGLLMIPLAFFVLWYRYRNRTISRWFSPQNIKVSIPGYSKSNPLLRFSLLFFAVAFLLLTLANPLAGKMINRQEKSRGSDIQFVVDVSNSMLCNDVHPTRLQRAQQILLGMISRMDADRAGLVVFAGEAYIQMPMTIDQTALSMFVRNLEPGLISDQGTDIGAALSAALESIDSSRSKYPVIVLLSDGEDFGGKGHDAISMIAERNIPVYVVALGSALGGQVPEVRNGVPVGFKKDEFGRDVVTKPDTAFLSDLAEKTGGLFVGNRYSGQAAGLIMDEIDRAEKNESRELNFSDYKSLYLWLLIPVFVMLLAEWLITDKRMSWQHRFRNYIERRHE